MKYGQHELRPDGDWVVQFWPNCVPPRLHPSLEAALDFWGNKTRYRSVFEEPKFIVAQFGPQIVYDQFNELCSQANLSPLPLSALEDRLYLGEQFWTLCQAIGDKIRKPNRPVEDDSLFTIRRDRIESEDGVVLRESFVKQKRTLVEGLLTLKKEKVTEDELRLLMGDLVKMGKLKTKQDPWRIFKYYAPELGDIGMLYYPGKRHKLQDHIDNV